MTSQLFWHSVTGTGLWGVLFGRLLSPILLPQWWGHISHAGAPELWGIPVSAAKCPWSHLESKDSTMVQKYCPNRWQLVWEEVWLSHHGICICNPFLKLHAVLLDPQHPLKVMSFVCSTDFSHSSPQPAVLQFGDRLILPQFLWLTSRFFCLFSHCGYVVLPKARPRPGVIVQVWLYHQSWQILPYISPRLRSLQRLPWNRMVLCLCIHLCISTYFCLAGDCKLPGLLLILQFK